MKTYTIWKFIRDLVLGAITGGLWWVYLIVKFVVENVPAKKDE